MTRINAHIPVDKLCDEHLRAEHREIKRICNRYTQRLAKNKFNDIPDSFRLGTGHELFFVNKPAYTRDRYIALRNECTARGFKMTNFESCWAVYKQTDVVKFVVYRYNEDDNNLIRKRISERLLGMQRIHYRGLSTTAQKMIDLLNQT